MNGIEEVRRVPASGGASPRGPISRPVGGGWAAVPLKSPRVRLERRMSAVNAEFKAAVLAGDEVRKALVIRRYSNLVRAWRALEEGGAR